jgi:hypothetical protein
VLGWSSDRKSVMCGLTIECYDKTFGTPENCKKIYIQKLEAVPGTSKDYHLNSTCSVARALLVAVADFGGVCGFESRLWAYPVSESQAHYHQEEQCSLLFRNSHKLRSAKAPQTQEQLMAVYKICFEEFQMKCFPVKVNLTFPHVELPPRFGTKDDPDLKQSHGFVAPVINTLKERVAEAAAAMKTLEQQINEEYERSALVLKGRYKALSISSPTVFDVTQVEALFVDNDKRVWSLLPGLNFGTKEACESSCDRLRSVLEKGTHWC